MSGALRPFGAVLAAFGLAASAHAATLKVGTVAWPPGYGNPYGSIAQAASHTRSTIYDALTRIDPAGRLVPALALSWQAVTPTTWRFELRPDVTFSNGEPFDAAGVVAVLDWLRSAAAAPQLMSAEVRNVSSVRAIDPLTVEIDTRAVDAVLPKRLSLIMMVPPRAWAQSGVEGFTQQPVGTGPYALKDWGLSSGRTVVEAFAGSWRPARRITRLELYPLRESVRRVQALSGGAVDLTQGIGPDDIDVLRDQGFVTFAEQEPQVMALLLRNVGNDGAALQDVRVRQALNYAVNKDEIAHVILRGTAQAVGQGAIPGVTGYNPDVKPYPHDPAKAKALLAEAGFGNGLTLVARVQLAAGGETPAIYQKVAADLAEAGITLELRPVMSQDWVRMYTTGDWGGADIISGTWNSAAYADTIRALETFSCAKSGSFYCDAEADALMSASSAELDEPKREALLQAAMARLHDQAASLFLVNMTMVVAHSPRVKNVVVGRSAFVFEEMELAED
ncbi:MAG: ABC transporter substrate-binding protein [Rhodospirillaceae bacterium]|nr:ABC transporter substrate-binding protein [Rhodospirillaceae bacterium]